jgi:mannose-6-phosphate isomerase-like protein (cupin superfamily)
MKIASHSKNIVTKPWGYEYLVYESAEVALWLLYIAHNQQTSFHAHPNKSTGLVILSGKAQIDFFNNQIIADRLEKLTIRKGFFHSTKSLSKDGTFLFEIETPNNKLDLVRFKDNYGREGKPYEDASFEYPKQDDCLNLMNLQEQEISFANCKLQIKKITSMEEFVEFDDKTNVMFLSGGLETDYNVSVINPADIVKVELINQLKQVFTKIKPDTYVIIFS